MSWAGHSIRVSVRYSSRGIRVTMPSGYDHALESLEGATFEEVAP